jgi:hypothetical protein
MSGSDAVFAVVMRFMVTLTFLPTNIGKVAKRRIWLSYLS